MAESTTTVPDAADAANDADSDVSEKMRNGRKRSRVAKASLSTISDHGKAERPQKRFFRQRAHCNPLSRSEGFDYPMSPETMDWATHFPDASWRARLEDTSTDSANSGFHSSIIGSSGSAWDSSVDEDTALATAAAASQQHQDVFADVGCGFGGLTVALANLYPDAISIGFEIRDKVTKYVDQRILHLREEHPGKYQNVSVMRTNAMRYLPNIFRKAQLTKMFFCFPDPQFKKKKHRRRIISHGLLAEYAYLLRPGVGRLYHITDVPELHEWMASRCRAHPCFEEINADEALKNDPAVRCMIESTEEGKKVARGGGSKFYAVFRRKLDSYADVSQLA